jgi:Spy/CpxP family protein refolding chaperone
MDRLFVQQLGPGLDSAAFHRYIANHRAKRKMMNRIRLVTIATTLMFALTTVAQQAPTRPGGIDKDEHGQRAAQADVPTVETQLKVLTEKLDLTGDQQARITPILQELHDATQKLVQDKSLSRDECLAKVRPRRYKANEQIREILSDDQKKKLDQYLQGPHSEMHGNLSGATPPPPRAPQN